MSLVRFSRACFAYAGGRAVFDNLNLSLERGFTGIVGENGGGKTTFLRLIAGELSLSAGHMEVDAALAERLLCRQVVDGSDSDLVAFACSYDREALRWQSRLAVGHLDFERFDELSPGEQKRWQIAAALARSPRVLLLDEPTNHLDAEGRRILLAALRAFSGVCLVVSHDRLLLDSLCPATVRVQAGTAERIDVPYSRAREVWASDAERKRAVHTQRRVQLEKSQKRLASLRDQRVQAQRSISARTRIKGPRDSDARSINARARAESGEARLSRKISVATTRAEREQDQLREVRIVKTKGTKIHFDAIKASRRRLAWFRGALHAGALCLVTDVDVEVLRGERILVQGNNGSGKTTLLDQLVASAHLSPDELLYVPQKLSPALELDIVQKIAGANTEERGEIMSIAAALGLDPESALGSASPSPGQVRKLLLALGLARRAALLVLDEPTNHLDLPSVERLEEALRRYTGALVVTTHDEEFARRIELSEVWHLDRKALFRAGVS